MSIRLNTIWSSLLLASAFSGQAHAGPGTLSTLFIKPSATPTVQANPIPVATIGEEVTLVIGAFGGSTNTCPSLLVDTGEGATAPIASAQLPLSTKVTYQTPGLKKIKISSLPGVQDACLGSISGQIYIAPKNGFTPGGLVWGGGGKYGKAGETHLTAISGSGHCDAVNIDFGDGTVVNAKGIVVFSTSPSHRYQIGTHAFAKPGNYNIRVWDSGQTHCGELKITAEVSNAPPVALVAVNPTITPLSGPVGQKPAGTTKETPAKKLKKCPKGKPGIDCDSDL